MNWEGRRSHKPELPRLIASVFKQHALMRATMSRALFRRAVCATLVVVADGSTKFLIPRLSSPHASPDLAEASPWGDVALSRQRLEAIDRIEVLILSFNVRAASF